MTTITTFIGRVSPFHKGHEDVFLRALCRSDVLIVLIGSSNKPRTTKDPFTFDERAEVIRAWFNNTRYSETKKLEIRPLNDYPYSDQLWMEEVQGYVNEVLSKYPDAKKPRLTGCDKDSSTWYLRIFGGYFDMDLAPQFEVREDTTTKNTSAPNATKIRENFLKFGKVMDEWLPVETVSFLRKFLLEKAKTYMDLVDEFDMIEAYKKSWASAPYAPTFVTVDAVVIQSGHILVVTRRSQPGKGLWALPGGFIEANERIVDSCIRELKEETSIGLSDAQLYGSITKKEVFDAPDRSLRGRTITHAYLLKLRDDMPLAKIKPQLSEVFKVEWLPRALVLSQPEKWFEDHHSIITNMTAGL